MSRQQFLSIGIIVLGIGAAQTLWAQSAPTWGSGASGSPTAGSSTSNKANAAADSTMYQDIQYVNAAKQGPRLVVIPGEIKSNNASFIARYGPTTSPTSPSWSFPRRIFRCSSARI